MIVTPGDLYPTIIPATMKLAPSEINMPITPNLDIIGGVVVESKDGALRYDLTYETLAREVFSNHMKEVSRILFG